jgi:murein DD-endopeptidase MepM/ murein hydrolase activator NlpD
MRLKGLKFFSAVLLCLCSFSLMWGQVAAQVIQDAVKASAEANASLSAIIQRVEKAASTADASNQRSLYTFLGSLQEQLGEYSTAASWYAKAAEISAAPAPNTLALTAEELILAAARCSLSCGESQQAEGYLTFLGNPSNEETVAYSRLYKLWSRLCRVQSAMELVEPVALLQSYATMDSMKWVRPSVYLTLWHLTEEAEWSSKLQKEYPKSAEAAVVTGKGQMLPTPFWFFIPKGGAVQNTAEKSSLSSGSAEAEKKSYLNKLSEQEKEEQRELEKFKADQEKIAEELRKIAEGENKNNSTNITSTPSKSGYIFPVAGLSKANINTKTYPSYPGHKGTDININVIGKSVVAVKDGTVVTSKAMSGSIKNYDSNGKYTASYGSYGEYIVINHHDGTMTLYAHMKSGSRKVSVGDKVKQGQVIGVVGNTGNCLPRPTPSKPLQGTHLHFEVRINGTPVNPLPYLP